MKKDPAASASIGDHGAILDESDPRQLLFLSFGRRTMISQYSWRRWQVYPAMGNVRSDVSVCGDL